MCSRSLDADHFSLQIKTAQNGARFPNCRKNLKQKNLKQKWFRKTVILCQYKVNFCQSLWKINSFYLEFSIFYNIIVKMRNFFFSQIWWSKANLKWSFWETELASKFLFFYFLLYKIEVNVKILILPKYKASFFEIRSVLLKTYMVMGLYSPMVGLYSLMMGLYSPIILQLPIRIPNRTDLNIHSPMSS